MQTIGQLLKQARQRKRKTINQIETETKIPKTTLEALETDDFTHLPETTSVKGFIRNYAQSVGLDPKKALAVFRRDRQTSEPEEILPQGLTKPLNEPSSSLRKKALAIVFIALIFSLFIGYAGWQLKVFLAPPAISVSQPSPGITLKGPIVEVKGWVSAESTVWVNDQLAEILPNGQFKASINLLSGSNTIIIKAQNRRGKTSEEKLAVEVVDK